ncbi:MAG: TraR/DksA C4-type zinc finger protein [bacterium]|nr:TraR/DksA C4-type zinc finger protein [bacterium]
MGRLNGSAAVLDRLNERITFIDQELHAHRSVPEEVDEPPEQDRLPVGRHDEIRETRAVRLSYERRELVVRLAQIEGGEEIVCAVCEEQIAIERLLAVLTATRCVGCQTRVERTDPRVRFRQHAVA